MGLAAPDILDLLIFISLDKGANRGVLSTDRCKNAACVLNEDQDTDAEDDQE